MPDVFPELVPGKSQTNELDSDEAGQSSETGRDQESYRESGHESRFITVSPRNSDWRDAIASVTGQWPNRCKSLHRLGSVSSFGELSAPNSSRNTMIIRIEDIITIHLGTAITSGNLG